MPGIAGIIRSQPYERGEKDLDLMIEAMRHEKFYRSGQYINKDLGLYVGWMGQHESFSDRMPLISRNKDVILILHAENYPNGDRSYVTSTAGGAGEESDASYLMRMYEESGENFVRRLNGWFCGLLADLRSKRFTLFNDRYGMGRIYMHEGRDEVLFGSEAKSLLRIRPELRTIDPEALAQYLRCNCVMGNRCLFKDITLLPGASSWSFNRETRVTKQRYFDFKEWEQQEPLSPDKFYQEFATTTSRIVPTYARGATKVALSLTAGLDTRIIMASLHAHDRSFPCYTFGGTWGETFDIRTARELASIYNQPYNVIRINDDFFKDFATFAQKSIYLSDGTHDALGAHDVYFNQMARTIAPVRLTGKFGSEIVRIRKLIRFFDFPLQLATSDLKAFLQRVPSPRQVTQVEHPLARTVSEEIPWYEWGRVAVEQSQLVLRTPYMDNELVKLMFRAPPGVRAEGQVPAQYVKDKSPRLGAILTNLSRSGKGNWLVKELLYLFFWSLFKAEYIYLFGTPHWLTWLDRRLEKLEPERLFAGRQKFEAYRIWIRTKLSGFIREALLNPNAQYTLFFDQRSVERMVNRHLAGTHNYLNEINKVLTFELICSSLLKP